jgi:hypothetical protein
MSALPVTELPSPIGTPATAAITTQLRGLLNRLLGWTSDAFPGGQPSSLTRATLGQLVEKSYFVCEKADGVRYLLLATRAGCFLVDQKYDFWKVDLHFPLRPDRVDPATNCLVHHFTLVDAELVMVKGDLKPKLLIFDMLALNGQNMLRFPLLERLKKIQNDFHAPHARYVAKMAQQSMSETSAPSTPRLPEMPCSVSVKQMHQLCKLNRVLDDVIPRQSYANDGLIFTPVDEHYHMGVWDSLLKCKPTSKHSVDFQLSIEWRGSPPTPGFKLMLCDKRTAVVADWITFSPEQFEEFKSNPQPLIVECIYDPDWLTYIPGRSRDSWDQGSTDFNHPEKGLGWRKGGWRLLRKREDKSMANDRTILEATCQAARDNVTLEELLVLCVADDSEEKIERREAILNQSKVLLMQKEALGKRKWGKQRSSGDVGASDETGVCYDWQNKGFCLREATCAFSHCACNTICTCTQASNTFGQRPVMTT